MATGQAANEPPHTTKGRYIVELRPLRQNETIDTYVRHLDSVITLCTGQRTPDGRPARIVDVLQYPEDSLKPTFFCYIGDFNDTISQSIQRTTDILNFAADTTVPLDVGLGLTTSDTNNWGLGYMSMQQNDYVAANESYTQAGKNKKLTEPDKRKSNNYFKYRGLPSRGVNSTVFVIDSGFDADILNQNTPEIDRQRFSFYSTNQYQTQKAKTTPAKSLRDWLLGCCAKTNNDGFWKQHEIVDSDREDYHGSNVSLFACSSRRGMAPNANLVAYDCAVYQKDKNGKPVSQVPMSLALIAMNKILNTSGSKQRSVLNCSWHADKDHGSYKTLRTVFAALYAQGVHIVGAAGNESVGKTIALKRNTLIPATLPYAFCVGNWKSAGTPSAHSNYASTEKANEMPKMVWAPGTDLPVWKGKLQENLKTAGFNLGSGTSYAAPILAGLLACILGSKQDRIDYDTLRKELNVFIREPKVGEAHLWWGDKS